MYPKTLGHVVCIVPCKNLETTDFITAKVIVNEPRFKENLENDINIDIDECVIEVEAKSAKGKPTFLRFLHSSNNMVSISFTKRC